VEGLILLLATAALWPLLKHRQQIIRFGSTIAVIAITGVFVAGQVHRLRELSGAQSGMALSREYCPSPQTFAWVRAHIPPGSTIMSTQCGYQLIAETNDYYWLRIPPADEYASSPKFLERWGEQDFLRVSQVTGAKWIVIPLGEKGDPLAENPGYGPFVARLLQGQDSLERIKRMASFADGRVYLIQ